MSGEIVASACLFAAGTGVEAKGPAAKTIGVLRAERVDRAAHALVEKPHGEADAAERVGEDVVGERAAP